jgi:dGTPase
LETKPFSSEAMTLAHPKWEIANERFGKLYTRDDDPRDDFWRDYNRILHCTAYRRLKHKTQVFFATQHDHICTRIEHVNHVAAVSETISVNLGLNPVLARAIAVGHDLGHAPFGHEGEKVIRNIAKEKLGDTFWHERNSLWFVDALETLENPKRRHQNLALTFAVRDGIICHCGEVNQELQRPRIEPGVLEDISKPGITYPFTWEGCVVKVADKIAYLGRDLEDARAAGLLDDTPTSELREIMRRHRAQLPELSNTAILHTLIMDLCKSSNLDEGMRFSDAVYELVQSIKDFNYRNIYYHPRLEWFKRHAEVVIRSLADALEEFHDGDNTLDKISRAKRYYPDLTATFENWIIKFTGIDEKMRRERRYENRIVYDINNSEDYTRCVLAFISGMTDNFALRLHGELIKF